LSMSQIYSALAYYWDYRSEMDIDIQRRFDFAENLRHNSEPLNIIPEDRNLS
jgi:hypothetical protein